MREGDLRSPVTTSGDDSGRNSVWSRWHAIWLTGAILLALGGVAYGLTVAQPNCEPMENVELTEDDSLESAICEDVPPPISTPTATPLPTLTPASETLPTSPATAVPSSTPEGANVVSPGQSITDAIMAAPAGATIPIRAGTYRELVRVTRPITLEPAGDGEVTIDGECNREHGVVITAHDVTIRNLTVRNTRLSTILIDGLHSDKPARATVEGNKLTLFDCDNNGSENEAGAAFWYAGSGQRVLNNTIDRRPAQSDPTGGKSNGIWFKSNTAHPSGGGHVIRGNTIRGVYDGIGGEVEDDPRGGFDRDTVIENNRIDTCHDDGISVEGGTQNVIVRNNTIQRCAIGIANAPNLTGPVTFENNRITEGRPGAYGNVLCFKLGDFRGNGPGIARYIGNTCQLGPGADGWAQTNNGMNPIYARRNEIRVGRYVIEMSLPATGSHDFDGDTLCTTDRERFVQWGGTSYPSLSAWRSATGQESSGRQC
jgi:hypothetical protein